MTEKDNIFSSKPKQIAQAIIQVLIKVFGSFENISLIVLSDMELPINIVKNLEKNGLKKCKIIKDITNFFFTKDRDQNNPGKLINLLKKYEIVILGFKNESKLIDSKLVRRILKERKQRPIFFVDCGIPGNIFHDVGKTNNCFLFDLNDLEQLYSSWVQKDSVDRHSDTEFFDFELNGVLNSFFNKLNFNLDQKMIFEKKIRTMLTNDNYEIKKKLKEFLKIF